MALTDKDKITKEDFDKSPKSYFQILDNIENTIIKTPSGHTFHLSDHKLYWLIGDGKFLGCCSIRYAKTSESINFLNDDVGHCGLSVLESQRNRGYGEFIWRQALKKGKEHGLKFIVGGANHENIASWRAIEKAGGVFSHNADDKYGWGKGKIEISYVKHD